LAVLGAIFGFILVIALFYHPPVPMSDAMRYMQMQVGKVSDSRGHGTTGSLVTFHAGDSYMADDVANSYVPNGTVKFCVEPLPEGPEKEEACPTDYVFKVGNGEPFEGSTQEMLEVKSKTSGKLRSYHAFNNEIWIGFKEET
jgi:hypothetical protein